MSYYQRPMGDYKTYGYAGDPGFLSSLWRGVKSVAKGLLGIPPAPPPVPQLPQAGTQQPYFQTPPMMSPGYQAPRQAGMPSFMVPGVRPLPPAVTQASFGSLGVAVPRGYHYAKDGTGRFVRNRRMNVANPRALRRAMRRVQGFEKLAKRTVSFTKRTRLKKA